MAKKNKMNYGTEDQIKGELDPKDEIVMISIKMEGDLLDAIKSKAAEKSLPYQTYLKQMLREQLLASRVPGNVEPGMGLDFAKRILALEAMVFASRRNSLSEDSKARLPEQPRRGPRKKVG